MHGTWCLSVYVHLLLSAHEKYKRSGVCLLGGGGRGQLAVLSTINNLRLAGNPPNHS